MTRPLAFPASINIVLHTLRAGGSRVAGHAIARAHLEVELRYMWAAVHDHLGLPESADALEHEAQRIAEAIDEAVARRFGPLLMRGATRD